jgi:hypothetical protein
MNTDTGNRRMRHLGLLAILLAAIPAAAAGAETTPYSPYQTQTVPMRVLWGDTHLHTSLSADANFAGNLRVGPEAALRFARGEEITTNTGQKARLERPLDFLVVADHAEYLGLIPRLRAGDPELLADPDAARWAKLLGGNPEEAARATQEVASTFIGGKPALSHPRLVAEAWASSARAVDAANTPDVFSAFLGFEWTSMPGGDNLHRIVMFRDGADRVTQVRPFSAFDSENPQALWRYLEAYERDTGGAVMAIPHNSDVSNGRMFTESMFDGSAPTADYTAMRARWEPLVEVTQIKGDSEAHPALSPQDAFADFGRWDKGNLMGTALKEPWMLKYEYAREALKLGLRLERQTGNNPYRFGMIGSSDAHNGLAAMSEDNFWGKAPNFEPSATRSQGPFIPSKVDPAKSTWAWEQLASGYAAVWATRNTRDAVFDAMRRREVYATTGPRLTVRFFGGWGFAPEDAEAPDLALRGYRGGVPMGATLHAAPAGAKAPRFLLAALRDPLGANLDRVQIVKGWLDADGTTLHERVFDVAWSKGRSIRPDGTVAPVGSTVDLEHARYRNSIGAAELATTWEDPEFDAAQPAFYYARVLEIPTPRWMVYDVVRRGATLAPEVPRVQQERAYTSPVWYAPEAR